MTYYEQHKKERLDYAQHYRERVGQDRLTKVTRVSQALERLHAFQVLGGQCEICGESDPTVLEFNHRNGDGKQHRKEGLRGRALVSWVLENQEEAQGTLQLVCANCHSRIHTAFNTIEGFTTPLNRWQRH